LIRGFIESAKEDIPSNYKLISLDRMKIPAIIIIIILLVFKHLDSALRVTRQTSMSFTVEVTGVIMDAIALLCTLFFLYNGIRLLLYLARASPLQTDKARVLLGRVRSE
jgi:hypothetical protein